MAFGTTTVHVKITSILLESLYSIKLIYDISVVGNDSLEYHLLPHSSESFAVLVSLNSGDPIPSIEDVCSTIEADVQEKFHGGVDSVEVDGVIYPYPPV